MILCPDTHIAAEICECEQRHICPKCHCPIPENADPGDPSCACEDDGERMATLEVW